MAKPVDGDRTLGAVAYILLLITGILVLLMAKHRDKYARWHAIQAIGVGIVYLVGGMVVGAIERLFLIGGPGLSPFAFSSGYLSVAWFLLTVVAIVVLALRAHKGEPLRLPFLGDIADTYA